MAEKEKAGINKNIVVGIVVVIVLIVGVYIGTQLQKPVEKPVGEIKTAEEADKTTTDLGNRLVGATGTIDKIVNEAQK